MAAAATHALGIDAVGLVSKGDDLPHVFNGHTSTVARFVCRPADGNQSAAAAPVAAAAANALGKNSVGFVTRGLHIAMISHADAAAVTTGTALSTNAHNERAASTSSAATAADALGNDSVTRIALCDDGSLSFVRDLDRTAAPGAAAVAAI